MNVDVFILFFNCILTTVLSSAVVIWILRKEYKPVIDELEGNGINSSEDEEIDKSKKG
ncbi:hypothetical protein QGM71_07240 [Virgibacillus sp. C22-A2]|uniref:YtzI protein n=1 Tax=Virgibacillus tibetensis TaxID=3042313 RepID=A0ABU6KEL7_9BACI|nr:hypothetical protein [Virgibacillus sp. C22-A2]